MRIKVGNFRMLINPVEDTLAKARERAYEMHNLKAIHPDSDIAPFVEDAQCFKPVLARYARAKEESIVTKKDRKPVGTYRDKVLTSGALIQTTGLQYEIAQYAERRTKAGKAKSAARAKVHAIESQLRASPGPDTLANLLVVHEGDLYAVIPPLIAPPKVDWPVDLTTLLSPVLTRYEDSGVDVTAKVIDKFKELGCYNVSEYVRSFKPVKIQPNEAANMLSKLGGAAKLMLFCAGLNQYGTTRIGVFDDILEVTSLLRQRIIELESAEEDYSWDELPNSLSQAINALGFRVPDDASDYIAAVCEDSLDGRYTAQATNEGLSWSALCLRGGTSTRGVNKVATTSASATWNHPQLPYRDDLVHITVNVFKAINVASTLVYSEVSPSFFRLLGIPGLFVLPAYEVGSNG